MKTTVLQSTPTSLARAARALHEGKLVAFPTETVYGVGANAKDSKAVKQIFIAKGRPQDNPLLVHVSSQEMLAGVVKKVPPRAKKLIDTFWPGPLTLILPAAKTLAPEVTAGLNTVAVRMPSNAIARALIAQAGVPIAAPSANTSGKPSPTTAAHVKTDLQGKIPFIVDGGPTKFGVESTIIDVSRSPAIILRPGAITKEAIERVIGRVRVAGLTSKLRAPGMKYRHYAPRAVLVLVEDNMAAARAAYAGKKVKLFRSGELTLRNLYAKLRKADDDGYAVLLVPAVKEVGDGLALMNRLKKAASRVI